MKRILLFSVMLFALASGIAFAAPAPTSRQSFTYTATAGMFEDMFDYFTYSPAYMPSFKRNVFWGQLANLLTHGDQIFGGSSTSTYQLGGQMATPFGRTGLMLDWYSYEESIWNQFYNEGGSHYGFGEGTNREYRDTDGNGDFDFQVDTYGRSEKTDRGSNLNLYAAYALPSMFGFDLGAALKASVNNSSPTYFANNPLGADKASFNEASSVKHYDYTLPNQLVYIAEDSTSGSWNHGWTDLRAILGGRSKGLLPGVELVANLVPVLRMYGNDLKWNYSNAVNYAAADPTNPHDFSESYSVIGSAGEGWNTVAPRKAFGGGFSGDVRGDMTLMPGVLLTGWLGVEMVGWGSKDGKLDSVHDTYARNTVVSGPVTNLEVTNREQATTQKWEDKGYDNQASAKVRLQFPAKG